MKSYRSDITFEYERDYIKVYYKGEHYCNCDPGELPEIEKELKGKSENEK